MKRLIIGAAVAATWLASASVALAGSVKKVSKAKSLVSIDLEEDETVEKDTQICFFNDGGKKVGCGLVVKIKGTMALVKIESEKDLKRIKPGMAAKVGKDGGDAEAAGDEPKKKRKKKKGDDDSGDDDSGGGATAASSKSKKSPLRVWVYYGPALSTPSVYSKLAYVAPTTTPATSLWSSDAVVKSSLTGFNAQVGIPLGAFSLNPGLRYRKFVPTVVDADYQPLHENPYVSTSETATAIGFWLDFQVFRMPLTPAMAINLTTGLDVDMSTVTVSATKKDDTGSTAGGPVASATSKLTTESLRLGASFDFIVVKPVGLSLGIVAMLPLAASETFSGSLNDGEGQGLADPGGDLKAALGHKKNGLAYEVDIGTVLAF